MSLTRTMQTNQAAEHRNVKWSDNPWNHSDLWRKVLWWKWFVKQPSLKVRMKDHTSERRWKWW